MLKRFSGPRGTVRRLEHHSTVLADNPLSDPTDRELGVYLPAGYDADGSERYPVLFALAGYTGSGLKMLGWSNFTENVPERLDRLIHEGVMPPVIVVFPDCFTALGGNQYIDSTALGPYGQYLTDELVPFVDAEFRTLEGREHRGVFGKSSGGYGALVHGMLYPDTWGGLACHSGDLYFEHAYKPDLTVMLDAIAPHGSVERFVEAFHRKLKPSGTDIHALMVIAMAASYDPDPAQPLGFHLPVDLHTGEIDVERWRRWLRWDPVEMVEQHGDALRRMACVFVDCGTRDQYRLHYGARIFHARLEAAGIDHHYDEFDDNHSSIDYRLDVSLPKLARSLAPR